MSVFVHAQDIKTVHAGRGVNKCQNSVHVVVECSLPSWKHVHAWAFCSEQAQDLLNPHFVDQTFVQIFDLTFSFSCCS